MSIFHCARAGRRTSPVEVVRLARHRGQGQPELVAVALGVLVLVGAVILQGDADEGADGSQPHPLPVGAARGALGEGVQHRRERLGREGREHTEAVQDDGYRQLLPLEGASERK